MFALIHCGQAGLLADARKSVAVVVVKELGAAPLDEEQIFVAVVVVVAPDRAHGDAGAGLIDVGDAQLWRNIFEGAVVHIAIESVLAALFAVGDVDVRPAVAVEIDNGNRSAHRRDLRHDAIELWIERGRLVNEIDAGSARHFLKIKAVTSQSRVSIQLHSGRVRVRRILAG